MKFDIIKAKTIDGKELVQITTVDERWYVKDDETFVPSSTWIASFYPKGTAFYKWLASKGWDEAEAIKAAAGNKGSKIHQAIAYLLEGNKLTISSKFRNDKGELEDLTPEEYEAILTFSDWFHLVKPKPLEWEKVVWGNISEEEEEPKEYAGTIDFLCEIGDELYLIDFKTGQNLWPEHELQLSSYGKALEPVLGQKPKLAFLQLGYRRNKAGWKLTHCPDKFHLFEAAYTIWQNECANIKPLQKDYPITIKLNINENHNPKKNR